MNNKSFLAGTGILLPRKYFSKQAFATPFADEYKNSNVIESSDSNFAMKLNGKPIIFTSHNGLAVPLTLAAKKVSEMVCNRDESSESLDNVVNNEIRLLDMFGRDLRTAPSQEYPVGTLIGVDGNPLVRSYDGEKGDGFKFPSASLPLIMILGLAGASGACKKSDSVPDGQARWYIHSQGYGGLVPFVKGESVEINASSFPGVDKNHVIVRKSNMGQVLAFNNTNGIVNVTLPDEGADIILLRDGSRYGAVENGRLVYGRNPTWNWGSTSYTPSSDEISFIESRSDEFSAVLSSVKDLNYGSLTKKASGGNIDQRWGYVLGGPYAERVNNIIAYNAARMSPDTVIGKKAVWEELFEMLIGLDDILGRDSSETICDSFGNLNQEGKDLLFYVFAKE